LFGGATFPEGSAPRNAMKSPFVGRLPAASPIHTASRRRCAMLQRIGLALVSVGLGLILGVMAMIAIDGMHPGRMAPGLAAWLAGGAGVAIIAGLRLLERGREPMEF
jgi:hypothetical protein